MLKNQLGNHRNKLHLKIFSNSVKIFVYKYMFLLYFGSNMQAR